jgi:hypothetical protein
VATQAPATQAPAAATQAPTKAATPLVPAATLAATKAPAGAATQAPAPNPREARIFMTALNDNGASGKKIGCGDSVVPVIITVSDASASLRGALDKLLAVRTPYYGQSGLYNALFRSDLRLVSVSVQNNTAEIKLGGALTIGGVCDTSRILAQFEATALQFSGVKQVNVYLNGKKLQDLFSGRR